MFTTLIGCSDFKDHSQSVYTGDLDFSKYMAIGCSFTAGFQSGALYEEAQSFAYPVLIAKQVGVSGFEFPNLTGEGSGGRIKWDGSFSELGMPLFSIEDYATMEEIYLRATNKNLKSVYNNIGIPESFVVIPGTDKTDFFDVRVSVNGMDADIGSRGLGSSRSNGFFPLILRRPLSSLWTSLNEFQPKVISFWLGNNDIFAYASSGGASPSVLTPPNIFYEKYRSIADSISRLVSTPKVVVGTIPDVITFPFFNAANRSLVGKIKSGKIYYYRAGAILDSIIVTQEALDAGTIYDKGNITLLGVSQIGNGLTNFRGLKRELPLSNVYVLDPQEILNVRRYTSYYNEIIKVVAMAKGWAIVDFEAEFNAIAAAGTTGKMFQGKKVTAAFISGGLFSYDGVHPSNLGQAIIANYMIKSLNAKYGAAIQEVDLNSISGLKFGKINAASREDADLDLRGLNPEPFKNAVRAMGGDVIE